MTLLFSLLIIFIAGCGQTDFSNKALLEKEDTRSEDPVGGFKSIHDGRL